jgi:LysM repeat protein
MKLLRTKGIWVLSLALLVLTVAACTQSKPAVPTPTLVPLANETVAPPASEGQPTPIIVDTAPTSASGEPTLIVPPGNETPASGIATPLSPEGQPTPIVVEPTLLPTPTTVGDTGQPPAAQATPAPGGEPSQPTAGSCTNPYTVQPGEWFYAIARKCGVTPQALVAANPGMNPSVLVPGQQIVMPAGSGGAAPQPEQPSQPPSNGGQPPAGGGACTNPYTVAPGDTLNSISRKCGVSVDAILQTNGIPDPNYIFPGQQLQIP